MCNSYDTIDNMNIGNSNNNSNTSMDYCKFVNVCSRWSSGTIEWREALKCRISWSGCARKRVVVAAGEETLGRHVTRPVLCDTRLGPLATPETHTLSSCLIARNGCYYSMRVLPSLLLIDIF